MLDAQFFYTANIGNGCRMVLPIQSRLAFLTWRKMFKKNAIFVFELSFYSDYRILKKVSLHRLSVCVCVCVL